MLSDETPEEKKVFDDFHAQKQDYEKAIRSKTANVSSTLKCPRCKRMNVRFLTVSERARDEDPNTYFSCEICDFSWRK